MIELKLIIENCSIPRDLASEWFYGLKYVTDISIERDFNWYFKKGYWPLKAQKLDAAEKNPKFIVCHHTSNKKGNYKPAVHRFLSAKKASSNFVIARDGTILYLVDLNNQSYHCVKRTFIPISVMRALNIEKGWINEPGIEFAGNGNSKLFSYEQFFNGIVLMRFIASYYPSIETIKSHRFFSKVSRANDPGFLFLLPLIEHAVFNNVDLKDPNYWLEKYKEDPIKFMNNATYYMQLYNVDHKDEWKNKRKIKITEKYL